MYGIYYYFNNLRFISSLNNNDIPFPLQLLSFVSNDLLNGRLLKLLLTHPVRYTRGAANVESSLMTGTSVRYSLNRGFETGVFGIVEVYLGLMQQLVFRDH